MAVQIQMRRDTYANWNTNDPTLAQGEWGLETDTLKFKIGTGSAAWSALAYSSLPSGTATLASPTFTGVPAAPTAAANTSTTQLATTAFVMTEVGDYLPLTGGTLAGVTLSGAVVGADQIISAPIMKDYAETVYAGGNTGSTETLDETNGNVQSWTLDASCTFTMPSGSGLKPGTSMTLILTQDGASRTGTFTGVKWAGGTAVTLSTGDDDVDVLTFTTFNGGASPVWYGFSAGLDMS
jgi:hypothetical protein